MTFCSKPISVNVDSCNTKVAGIVEVKIAPVNDPDNEITLYTIPETSHLESVFAFNAQNGTGIWTSTLFIKIGEISDTNRNAVESMAFNHVIIKAETQSGQVVTVGTAKRPAYMSAGNLATGTAMEDAMGYDVTFTQKDITSPEVVPGESSIQSYTFSATPTSISMTPGQSKSISIISSGVKTDGGTAAVDYNMSSNFAFQANQGMQASLDKSTNTITVVSRGYIAYTNPKITLTQTGSGKVITIPVSFTNVTPTDEYVLQADVTSIELKPGETKKITVTSHNTSDPSKFINTVPKQSWKNEPEDAASAVKGVKVVYDLKGTYYNLTGLQYLDIGSNAVLKIKQYVTVEGQQVFHKTLEIPVKFTES